MINYFLFHVTIKYIWFFKNIAVACIIHNLFFLHYMSGILNMNGHVDSGKIKNISHEMCTHANI